MISTILDNLKEAIGGECNAQRKYQLFAEKAREEDLHEISHLFDAISSAEAIHIKNHLKALEIITKSEVKLEEFVDINEEILKTKIKDTKSNLLDAIEGETYETKQMYKTFLKNSKKEGNEIAELTFHLARKAEKVHANIFSNYLKRLEKNEKIVSQKIFVCQICGNVEFGTPPSVCPICEHNQRFFKEV